jgi:antitoxin component YwqK of YwqJK toxin-antitoxin module
VNATKNLYDSAFSILNMSENREISLLMEESNTAPNTPSVGINSSEGENRTSEDLNCYATISDPEGNSMNATVRWYKNGVLNRTLNFKDLIQRKLIHWYLNSEIPLSMRTGVLDAT